MELVNIQVIKDELERLIRNYRFYSSWEAKYRYEAYKELSEWLDGLEVEEPSKNLEEAARKVGQKYFPDENNIWARPNYEAIAAANAFKEGAKWQEEQIMKDAIEQECAEGRFEFNPNRSFEERCEIVRRTAITKKMTYEERLGCGLM